MLPFVFLQLCVVGASAATTLQIQEPLNWLLGNVVDRFPHPHPAPGRTIYETIVNDYRFTKLTKAINFVGDDIVSVLNDTSKPITFFAVPDKALRPPDHYGGHGRHGRHGHESRERIDSLLNIALPNGPSSNRLSETDISSLLVGGSLDFYNTVTALEELQNAGYFCEGEGDDPDDDPEKERRRKIFKMILTAVLNYHVLPDGAYSADVLGRNTTYPTNFKVPVVLGGHAQRIKVSEKLSLHPKLHINLYAKVKVADIKAENGVIHVLNHPLLPPLPIFQELFLAQHHFSTFTSALQRTGLTDQLDLRFVPDDSEQHGHFEGTTATTVFAVPNKAFHHLPPHLRFFLFSPFGTNALRKLLEYHIIPGVVAHADWLYNQTAGTVPDFETPCTCGQKTLKPPHKGPRLEPISSVNVTLDTRFENHTVEWYAEKFKASIPLPHGKKIERFETKVLANRHPVHIPDIVGLNGVIHILDRLLVPYHGKCPCPGHGGDHDEVTTASVEDEWADWESWLPQWAEEN